MLQNIFDGVTTLAHVNIDWSRSAGAIWLVGFVVLCPIATRAMAWATTPRVVDARNTHY